MSLLLLAGCTRDAAAQALDPKVLAAIQQLETTAATLAKDADATATPAFLAFVALGAPALPTIEESARITAAIPTRLLLIDAIGRIGDARSLPMLQRFTDVSDWETCTRATLAIARIAHEDAARILARDAESTDADRRERTLDAIGRMQRTDLLPFLRELRQRTEPTARIPVLKALLRLGDVDVVREIVQLGLADEKAEYSASAALQYFAPLREALGLKPPTADGFSEAYDRRRFLRAADEWHHGNVLHTPSPWTSSPASVHGEPFAREKQQAWTSLLAAVGRHHHRAYAVPPTKAAPAVPPQLTILHGFGHGGGIGIDIWQRDGETMRGLLLSHGDRFGTRVRAATVSASDFAALVAGMRAVLDARIEEWWTGPGFGSWLASADLCIVVLGLDRPRRFCGYVSSDGFAISEPLNVAQCWYAAEVEKRAAIVDGDETAAVRAAFAATFCSEQPQWTDDFWWWVRERMVAMASDLGDASLCLPLARYLEPRFVGGDAGQQRTADAAIAALAAITGQDLRRRPLIGRAGERPRRELALAYRRLLTYGPGRW